MRKILISVTLTFVVTFAITFTAMSYSNSDKRSAYYLDLNSEELRAEIMEYDKIAKNNTNGKPYVLTVECETLNSSATLFTLSYSRSARVWDYFPFQFICKVGGKDVFFSTRDAMVGGDGRLKPLFELNWGVKMQLMKKYFPEEFKEYFSLKRTAISSDPPQKVFDLLQW